MYKGLKVRLEEVVSKLNIGDGIVVEHPQGYFAEKSIGYIKKITSSYISLHYYKEKSVTFAERLQAFIGYEKIHYEYIDNVRVVDPVKKEK